MTDAEATSSGLRQGRRVVRSVRLLLARSSAIEYLGWLGHRNLGDEALFDAVARYFRPVPLVHRDIYGRPFANELLARRQFQSVMLGGGTLIGSDYLKAFREAVDRSTESVVFGSGVQDERFWVQYRQQRVSVHDWVSLLARCSYVGVRGPDSAAALAKHGLEVEVLGDPACSFSMPSSYWRPVERKIGVNMGQSMGKVWGSEAAIVDDVASLLRELRLTGWEPEFFVVWPHDLEITREVIMQADLGDVPVHCVYNNAEKYLRLVRRMNFFVGLKLHAVVLAMCAAVPSLMLEYRPKCLDFMRSVGMERYSVRTDRLKSSDVVLLVDELAVHGAEVSVQVAESLGAFKKLQIERAAAIRRDVLHVA